VAADPKWLSGFVALCDALDPNGALQRELHDQMFEFVG
jgi:hypothetical protein